MVLDFFFFKQKTAYEMRISDWSSDVCSSDLPGCSEDAVAPGQILKLVDAVEIPDPPLACAPLLVLVAEHQPPVELPADTAQRGCRQDRKSVVEGKSVSVRVDLGGRRSIKKKQKQHIEVYQRRPVNLHV